ncbi:MAG: hypothetical protein M1829_001116 [Trizodia sp. TS-e1964]|nr:MAG: hypothetical protein M1829_001116 [Trizodia sp. TS-e1964]
MLRKSLAAAALIATGALAQRPTNTSICDYYTTALLKNNTAANQLTLLTLVVNTAIIGNYTQPNVGIAVPGILAPGKVNGTDVNLAPYFNGKLASTNRGDKAVSVNFLDDGGAAPLLLNKAANGTSSNQFNLLNHLYEFFGSLLGCSQQGMPGYPSYDGIPSMYTVHKFMKLDPYQMEYFITQVGLAAVSFGVTVDDITIVGKALQGAFSFKCAPAVELIKGQGAQLPSMCTDDTCPLAPMANCAAYPNNGVSPAPLNATSTSSANSTSSGSASSTGSSTGTATGSATGSSTASASSTAKPNAAGQNVIPVAAIVGAAVLAFAL